MKAGDLQPVSAEADAGEPREPEYRLGLGVCDHHRTRAHDQARNHACNARPTNVHHDAGHQRPNRIRCACYVEDERQLASHRQAWVRRV